MWVLCIIFVIGTRYGILPLEGLSAFPASDRAGGLGRFEGVVPEADVLGDESGDWDLACGRGKDGS